MFHIAKQIPANILRAAVMAISKGLISNASLKMPLTSDQTIVTAGLMVVMVLIEETECPVDLSQSDRALLVLLMPSAWLKKIAIVTSSQKCHFLKKICFNLAIVIVWRSCL